MVRFTEHDHKYFSEDNLPWVSVTQLISQYCPKKDWDQIARTYAKKHNLSVEEVKEKWRKNNEISLIRGTQFHKEREQDLLSCKTIDESGVELKIFPSYVDSGVKISRSQKLEDGIYPELLVYLSSARICGQADYVTIFNGKINIRDFKTNKELKMNGWVNWDGIEEKMLDPLTNIPNCNYWHYAIQLNIYAYIIKKNNPKLKIGDLDLLHARFDDSGELCDVVSKSIPNLQSEVTKLINHYKNKNNGSVIQSNILV